MGIPKTKARAREAVYWPNINQPIEMLIKKCEVCQSYQKQQQKETMIPSDIPIYPFQIVASNLFNWKNQDFAIVVDYYSKYWEIERNSSAEYPKSNGFVERHIQIVKTLLTKAKQSGKDPYLAILKSRNCPAENYSSFCCLDLE